MQQFIKTMEPAIATLVAYVFGWLATRGYFTPQEASEFTKTFMDFLTLGLVPFATMAWQAWRNRPVAVVARTDSLPNVEKVVTKDTVEGRALKEAVQSPTVITTREDARK